MSSEKRGIEILFQMIAMKESMQQEYQDLGHIVNNPEANSRAALRALRKQAHLAVTIFELSMEITYAARMLGYGSENAGQSHDARVK